MTFGRKWERYIILTAYVVSTSYQRHILTIASVLVRNIPRMYIFICWRYFLVFCKGYIVSTWKYFLAFQVLQRHHVNVAMTFAFNVVARRWSNVVWESERRHKMTFKSHTSCCHNVWSTWQLLRQNKTSSRHGKSTLIDNLFEFSF